MPRILVVEDEPDILELVSYNLKQVGFEVTPVEDGESAFVAIERANPDLIVLDLMLPGMDGLEVCRLLKQKPDIRDVPILILTARAEEVDRIVGLELGADDYVIKPFSPRELVLRIRAILRRVESVQHNPPDASQELKAGLLRIDPVGYQVFLNGVPVELTATEFKLLLTLMQRRGRVQTREELLQVVWGYHYRGYARTVDTHMRRLRVKLDEASRFIETVRGVGYRFRNEGE